MFLSILSTAASYVKSKCQPCPTSLIFASTHLYTWVLAERGAVRIKSCAQEYSTMSPARAQTQTTQLGVECTNHEATVPPYTYWHRKNNGFSFLDILGYYFKEYP